LAGANEALIGGGQRREMKKKNGRYREKSKDALFHFLGFIYQNEKNIL